MDPIYIFKTTKAHAKEDVRKLFINILGNDAIDRLLVIDGVDCDLRVFVIVFWGIPKVNEFHQLYTEPGDTLYGKKLPGVLEQLDPYGIFRDGHFPAPHFLRNSKNLTDDELYQLGIGGGGEFIYVQLPTDEDKDLHWEMYRDGVYYMPDMSYYNKYHLDPLSVTDKPLRPSIPRIKTTTDHKFSNFERWRDFYIEHPATWPKDLTHEERANLEETYASLDMKCRWTPECGRDPTNLAEEQERLEAVYQPSIYQPPPDYTEFLATELSEIKLRYDTEVERAKAALPEGFVCPQLPLERQMTEPYITTDISRSIPQREGESFPAQERIFFDRSQYSIGKYKWNYRKFD